MYISLAIGNMGPRIYASSTLKGLIRGNPAKFTRLCIRLPLDGLISAVVDSTDFEISFFFYFVLRVRSHRYRFELQAYVKLFTRGIPTYVKK